MPGGDDKKEDDKAPETPEAKAEREQQVGCEEKVNENKTKFVVKNWKKDKNSINIIIVDRSSFFLLWPIIYNLELRDSSSKMQTERKKKCYDPQNDFMVEYLSGEAKSAAREGRAASEIFQITLIFGIP